MDLNFWFFFFWNFFLSFLPLLLLLLKFFCECELRFFFIFLVKCSVSVFVRSFDDFVLAVITISYQSQLFYRWCSFAHFVQRITFSFFFSFSSSFILLEVVNSFGWWCRFFLHSFWSLENFWSKNLNFRFVFKLMVANKKFTFLVIIVKHSPLWCSNEQFIILSKKK